MVANVEEPKYSIWVKVPQHFSRDSSQLWIPEVSMRLLMMLNFPTDYPCHSRRDKLKEEDRGPVADSKTFIWLELYTVLS
ncbi:predicted protein [Sclerotinia sclerotiorum 1980 UF-70]|uniref:Uncharacterized protein n=1 Tax=Sclerotinia sclerotiorum (strain ATCC 18683 / 1980 / Ss-1) TaxID=665079 RepID=A7ESU4_SCLS1|nr:predicted protein [Sclerotinia sclerotiorum 1980 UF-70]EDN92536.1 predicted protein [Sclerotinia sclerotiorum 1980 UF-70]